MSDFNQQRQIFKNLLDSEELVNTTLVTEDGGQLKVHLEVLLPQSPYFRRTIDSVGSAIQVPGTSKDNLKEIINYMYTGKLCLRESVAKELIDTAQLLEVHGIIELIKQFLESTFNVDNCISRCNLATCYQLEDLKEKAKSFILANFEKVYKTNASYADINLDDLLEVLNSDVLNVKQEEDVYWAILKWVVADSNSRTFHLPSLIRCLRMGLCDFSFFEDQIRKNELINSNEECCDIIIQMFADLQGGNASFDLHHPFLRQRQRVLWATHPQPKN